MKTKIFIISLLFFTSCVNKQDENLKITVELLKGTWQFFDADSVYTEMEISDSVYFYVHAPMNIFRAEPSTFSVDTSGLYFTLLYDDGEVWQKYELIIPDSFTLKMANEDVGQFICKKIYPKRKISTWKQEEKFTFDSLFLAREKKFLK